MSNVMSTDEICALRDQNETPSVPFEQVAVPITTSPQPSTSRGQNFIIPFQISPVPEITPRKTTNRGRKAAKSTLHTSSKYINELQDSLKKKQDKIEKTENKPQKGKGKGKATKLKSKEVQISSSEDENEPLYNDSSDESPDRRNVSDAKCLYCEDLYSMRSKTFASTMDSDVTNYSVVGRIGEGAHGLVFKARHLTTGREVALKKILIKNLEDGIPVNVMREIKALQLLRCKYVIKLYDMFPRGMSLVLVLEYMTSGLWEMLHHNQQELTLPRVKSYAQMLLKGTRYMHAHYVMHRDLKPANLLINHEGILKIADLGLARLYWPDGGRPYSHQVATRWYRAPELLYGARFYSEKVDLWAVGCIIAEMITKQPLFAGESDIEQLAIVLQHLGTPTEESWPGHQELPDFHKITFPDSTPTPWTELLPGVEPDAIYLIKSFILYDDNKRMSAKEALRHQWFQNRPLPASLEEMPIPSPNKSK